MVSAAAAAAIWILSAQSRNPFCDVAAVAEGGEDILAEASCWRTQVADDVLGLRDRVMAALLLERIKLVSRFVTEAAEEARGLLLLGGESSMDEADGDDGQAGDVLEPAAKLDGSCAMGSAGKSG